MFTWICPKCGREVPPSMQDCPNCAPVVSPPATPQPVQQPTAPQSETVQPTAPAPALPIAPPQIVVPPPPAAPVPQGYAPQPTYQPPVYHHPPVPPASGLPAWLVTVLVFVGLLAAGSVFYFYLLPNSKSTSKPAEAAVVVDEKSPAKVNPLAKQLEVTGIRITEDAKQKLQIRMTVINHSAADMGDLKLNVSLTADSGKGPATVIGTFPVVVKELGPFEARETKSSMITNLRAYELPDWQFLRAKAEITTE